MHRPRCYIRPALAVGAVGAGLYGAVQLRKALERRRWPHKGVFVEYSLYDAPAETLRKLGISWVLLQSGIMRSGQDDWILRDRSALEATARRLNPPGARPIEIWAWGWPIPERADEFAAHVRDVLESPIITGYCLNIEAKRWSTRDHGRDPMEAAALRLIQAIRRGPRKPLTLSSHGRADLTPVPWRALSTLDGGMPQCYDPQGRTPPGFIERCIDSYRKAGFEQILPTLGAASSDAQVMQAQIAELPPVRGVSWWTWTQIGRSPKRAAALASCCKG